MLTCNEKTTGGVQCFSLIWLQSHTASPDSHRQTLPARRYTSRSAAAQFEAVLEAWETAAAAVLQREAILEQVLQIKAADTFTLSNTRSEKRA